MKKCTFAPPGTYGHECGKPATLTMSRPSLNTKSGTFYAFRCEECAKIVGGENARLSPPEAIQPTHTNNWK
jgi:hypothetical protein